MKERIVIEKEVLCRLLDWVSMQMVVYKDEDLKKERKIFLFGKEYQEEKVPETWEELVELCKHYKDIEIGNGIIRIEREDSGNIEIYSLDGTIVCNEYFLAEDRTISQMWEIIKNLMEENK